MSIRDNIKNWINPKPIEVIVEKPILADQDTQFTHRGLLNQATSYMRSKQEIMDTHKSKLKKLTEQADYVTTKTIKDWRDGLSYARDINHPNRYYLQEVYTELRLDPFLDGLIRFQKNKLTHINRYIQDVDGNNIEGATKLVNSPWFDQIITGFVDSQLQGFKLLEINKIVKEKGILTIDRLEEIYDKNVIPEFQQLKKESYSDSIVYDYSNDDYIIEIIHENSRNLGILSKLAPYLIYKKLALNSWSTFIEDFSQPSMIIKSPIKNTDQEDELLNTLENINSSLRMVLDTNDEFEFVQANNVDAYQSFKEIISLADRTAANEIIGGSLLFTGGQDNGSYALSNTHESVSQLKTLSDLRDLEKYINQFIIPKLIRLGLLENKEQYFYFTPEEFMTMEASSRVHDVLMRNGYQLNKEYLEKIYKVKIDGYSDTNNTSAQ